jgi:hypothetical protein
MTFQRTIGVVGLLFVLLSLSIVSGAQRRDRDEDRWEQLGRATVNGRVDHDRIFVNSRASFRALQLGVKGGTIEFQRVVVHFENGADHELPVPDRIQAGGKTRVIDLPGDRRRIRSVEFWYAKETWRSRPFVNLWGRR